MLLPKLRRLAVLIPAGLLIAAPAWLAADEPAGAVARPGIEPTAVAATVEGQTVLVGEVARALRGAIQGRPVNPAALAVLQAQTLDQLVDRRLVQQYLEKSGVSASPTEIGQALEAFKSKLAEQDVALGNVLKHQGLTEDDLRAQAAWELSWKKYLARRLTDQALQAYFDSHRKEFDGSKVEASHILLRPERSGDAAALPALVKQAQEIRAEITSGKLSFADAARKYSAGPSRHNGGSLGSFPRHGVMLDGFSRAAFALEPGEISQPVHTRFGIHLILCTGIEPGDKKWTDVRAELETPVTQELFNKLAQQQRSGADIKFTGVIPYIDPVTRKLVAQ